MSDVILWAVYANTDNNEGRGREYVKHFCRTEATAIRMGRNGYVQGSDCPVKSVKALLLDGKHVLPMSLIEVIEPTKEDVATQRKMDARNAALAKAKELGLSDEEIAALINGGRP